MQNQHRIDSILELLKLFNSNKSDFEPGDLIIDSKSIPIASDFEIGMLAETEFLLIISLILSVFA